MKQMKVMLILLSITMALTAQFREKPLNAVYLAYQPWDHGLEIRGDVLSPSCPIIVHMVYWPCKIYTVVVQPPLLGFMGNFL